MKTGERLRKARELKNLGKSELARAIGVTPSAISQWESGDTQKFDAMNLWKASVELGVTMDYLLTGRGDLRTAIDTGRFVPLISWVQAGNADEAFPSEAEKTVPAPKNASPRSFALEVRGESMTDPTGKMSFPQGCYIVVDPEQRSPMSGTPIIAKIVGEDRVTFKIFVDEDGQRWLRPLNPTHPIVRDEFRVLGAVISMTKNL